MTWLLALCFVGLIDATFTRSRLLWAPVFFENRIGLHLVQLGQTFQVARSLFGPPPRPAAERVAILGDSRIWFGAQAAYVERELQRQAPGRDVRIDQLAIFGARVGDFEALSRHLDRLDPDLVVLVLGGLELLPFEDGGYGQWPQQIFATGWADGPLPAAGWNERVDRWARTVSRLYRLRLFCRFALVDRLFPKPLLPPFPQHFDSTRAVHDYLHRRRGARVETAYRAWRAAPTLDNFVLYLQSKHPRGAPVLDRAAPAGAALAADSPALVVLDRLLARLSAASAVRIVLLPENPLLDQDVTGRHHELGFSAAAAAQIRAVAARHGVAVVDGRRWLPAEAFSDFVHPFPDVSGLQRPLAAEILHALDS